MPENPYVEMIETLQEEPTGPMRFAEPEDRMTFAVLWAHFLQDQFARGGDTLPTDKTLDFFMKLFDHYTANPQEGFVLFGTNDASVLMWGTPNHMTDVRFGRVATGWGTYISPEYRRKGESKAMWDLAREEMIKRDIADAIIGSVLDENPAGMATLQSYGVEFYSRIFAMKMKE